MTLKRASLRSPLGQARGLGSAKEGVHHWWAQRVTAVALVPLSIWLVATLVRLSNTGYAGFVSWFSNPIHVTVMILLLGVSFHHAQLGVQVVVEDYIPGHGPRIVVNMLVNFVCYALAALSIVSILIVAFKG
ncbi:MAG: succinate dehydrogenase, hydrophobic membrane anchor protein [Rhodospirillaceae bacterium]|nr:succinate dehydrogenase, hydrophobic membrane anchor protein [Rhodospirillaceae bacterium]